MTELNLVRLVVKCCIFFKIAQGILNRDFSNTWLSTFYQNNQRNKQSICTAVCPTYKFASTLAFFDSTLPVHPTLCCLVQSSMNIGGSEALVCWGFFNWVWFGPEYPGRLCMSQMSHQRGVNYLPRRCCLAEPNREYRHATPDLQMQLVRNQENVFVSTAALLSSLHLSSLVICCHSDSAALRGSHNRMTQFSR